MESATTRAVLTCGEKLVALLALTDKARASNKKNKKKKMSGEWTGYVLGDFQVGRKLGIGGFGEVYEAINKKKNMRCALKIAIHGHNDASLANEHSLGKALRGVDGVVCISSVSDIVYRGWWRKYSLRVATSPLKDGSLQSALAKDLLTPHDIPDLLAQLCSTLKEIHALGVIHRDISPDNILYQRKPQGSGFHWFIGDFGISTADADRELKTFCGKIVMLPPEMRRTAELTPAGPMARYSFAADWWCIGITMEDHVLPRVVGGSNQRVLDFVKACLIEDPEERRRQVYKHMPSKRLSTVATWNVIILWILCLLTIVLAWVKGYY